MTQNALARPETDPTPIFEHFRGNFANEILTAAVCHFTLFGMLAESGPTTMADLGGALGLRERPLTVLITALRAMGLLRADAGGRVELTPISREHLVPGGRFDVGDYVGLMANSPGVRQLVERLRTDRPAGAEAPGGAAFIYREGIASAMEAEDSARHLTLALAGRARNVAPALAEQAPLADATRLLDVGGGTGIYAIAYLQAHQNLRATVWDRPEVLKVADEMARSHGVADRFELRAGDMFEDPVPEGHDAILLSNVLHDWDVSECRRLVGRLAGSLPVGGRLLIHDVFLDDDLGGPLAVALYSASLFSLTEGRAYSAAEYWGWLAEAGLMPGEVRPTSIHCAVLPAVRTP